MTFGGAVLTRRGTTNFHSNTIAAIAARFLHISQPIFERPPKGERFIFVVLSKMLIILVSEC